MIVGVLLSYLAAPLSVVASALVWLRLRERPNEGRILAALDRLLEEDSAALARKRRADPLRFRTAERVPLRGAFFGLGVRSSRADVVRIIRAATPRAYRVRVRAFVRVVDGRTLVRWRDVDVPRR